MMLAAALVLLAILAVSGAMLPMLRGGQGAAARAQFDRAVYRDQLEELDRDVARGLLDAREAAGARLEIERRLLAADATLPAIALRTRRNPLLAGAIAATLAIAAGLAYLALGAPLLPDLPLAQRGPGDNPAVGNAHQGADVANMVAALAEKLKADPGNLEGWKLLARSEGTLQQWQAGADAYRHALALQPNDPESLTGYGEMLVLSGGDYVTPEARDVFAHALSLAPNDDVAQFYMALGDAQAGKTDAAIAAWQKLAAAEPADSDLRAEALRRIGEAAAMAGKAPPPAPPAAPAVANADADATAAAPSDMAAATDTPPGDAAAAIAQMPEAQRDQMIRSMVAQLAQRLEAQPNDPDGWLRLGRSYLVLGEPDQAADAYDHAAKLKPNDVSVPLQEIDARMSEEAAGTPFPPRVMTLLHRVEAIDPHQPDALWYLGLAAAAAQQSDEARRYWTELLPLLPAGSDQSKKVEIALQRLPPKS